MVNKTSTADAKRLGYIGRQPTEPRRDSDSWNTPAKYIESVRKVLERIDLDPFTSEEANKGIKAAHIFTKDRSAFDSDWNVCPSAKVWMNPPYSGSLCKQAARRYVDQFKAKQFSAGIVLINNSTETEAFRTLAKASSAVCFTDHRIKFDAIDGKRQSGNTRGQAFIYHGKSKAAFFKEFRQHGLVMEVKKDDMQQNG
jgi:phage N-6-adenine-methyltransferase